MGAHATQPIYAAGNSVQVANAEYTNFIDCDTAMPIDNTKPQVTEGDEVMTLNVTPRFPNGKLRVDVIVQGGIQTSNISALAALFEATIHATNAIACGWMGNTNYSNRGSAVFSKIIDVTVVREYAFEVRFGATSGGVGFNGHAAAIGDGTLTSSITVTEIKG